MKFFQFFGPIRNFFTNPKFLYIIYYNMKNKGKTCVVLGCTNPAKTKGYCHKHYMKIYNKIDSCGTYSIDDEFLIFKYNRK